MDKTMKVLVCGSRTYSNRPLLRSRLDTLHVAYGFTHLIHGNARGADIYAHFWAVDNKIHSHPFKANWREFGRAAGTIRNTQMLREGKPDLCIAFVDKPLRESRGTYDMVTKARGAGIETQVFEDIT